MKAAALLDGTPPSGNRRILIRNAGAARREELVREQADALLRYHKHRKAYREREVYYPRVPAGRP